MFAVILFLSCEDKKDNGDQDDLLPYTQIHESNNDFVKNVDLDYPYLYVAGGEDGLWRIDLSDPEFPQEELPLLDSTKGITAIDDIDAEGDDIIAAAGYASMWASDDGGLTWSESYDSALYGWPVRIVSRSPHDPNIIMTRLRKSSHIVSEDNGKTWTDYYNGISHSQLHEIYWNPLVEGEAWIWGMGDLYYSDLYVVTNNGQEKKENISLRNVVEGYQELSTIEDISFDYTDGQIVYIIASYHEGKRFQLRSEDGGYTWTILPFDTLESIIEIEQNRNDPSIYYIASWNSVFISTDSFKSTNKLTQVEFKIENDWIEELIQDTINNRLIIRTFGAIYILQLE